MGGVVAIFEQAPEGRLRERAAAMAARSAYRGASLIATAPGAAVGVQHRAGEASLAEDAVYLVAYLGTGSDNAELQDAAALLQRLTNGSGDAAPAALTALPADVAAIIVEKASRHVHFATGLAMTRPLYYHASPERLVIASEIRQVCLGADMPQRLDKEQVAETLLFHGPVRDGRRTAYLGVQRSAVTEYNSWMPGQSRVEQPGHYWQPPELAPLGLEDIPELARELRGLLSKATQAAAGDDAALSLSGGLDSTSLWALAREHAGEGPGTAAIALGFPGFEQDESANIRALLEHTRSSARILDASRLRPSQFMREHCEHLDAIPGAPTLYYLDLLGKLLRQEGRRAHISGIGAECQLSPGLDYAVTLAGRGHILTALGDLLRFQDYRALPLGRLQKLKRAARYLLLPPGSRLRQTLRPPPPPGWLMPGWHDLYRQGEASMWRYHRQLGHELGAKWFALAYYGVGSGLENVEHLGERYGVSLRTPFLARPVTDFGFRVPSRVILGAARQKHLLRLAMQDLLPPRIADQHRKVIHVDLARQDIALLHLAGPPKDWCLVEAGIVDPETTTRWWTHMNERGLVDSAWSQLVYGELFCRRYLT